MAIRGFGKNSGPSTPPRAQVPFGHFPSTNHSTDPRACRTGNFIAFFRLARKVSYLQACLMHAHYSKLRTQALASLHSGLQMNQGIPISHVSKWLAMELKKDPEPIPTPLQVFSPKNTMQPHYEQITILSPKRSIQMPMHKLSTDQITPEEKMTENEIQLPPASPLVFDFSNNPSDHNNFRVESAQKAFYDPVFRNSFGRTIKNDLEKPAPNTLEKYEEFSCIQEKNAPFSVNLL